MTLGDFDGEITIGFNNNLFEKIKKIFLMILEKN